MSHQNAANDIKIFSIPAIYFDEGEDPQYVAVEKRFDTTHYEEVGEEMEIRFSPHCEKSTAIAWLYEAIRLIEERGMPDSKKILKEENMALLQAQDSLRSLGLHAINIEDRQALHDWIGEQINLK